MTERPPYRLPSHVVPSRYELEINPDLKQGTFHGMASITVEVKAAVREFVVNGVSLTLGAVRLQSEEGSDMAGTVSYNVDEEQITLSWPELITPGLWILAIEYDGVLADDLRGFYRTTVKAPDGTSLVMASSHCEATDARRIFPGWDEPEFKAVFAMTLIVDPGLTALSNAREIASHVDSEGKRHVKFADTVRMSSYLVALVVGPLTMTTPKQVGEVPVRIAARESLSHLTEMAEEAAVGTLQFFEEYFGIPYPGDKMDHVAVPDFAAGAW